MARNQHEPAAGGFIAAGGLRNRRVSRGAMKGSLRRGLAIKKNRLKSRAGNVWRDTVSVLSLIIVICLVTSGFIYLFSYIVSSPYFRVKGVVVRGVRELTEKDILALAAVKPSQTIFSVNVEALARRVMSEPWVKEVAVSRQFPNRLLVEIRERKPLALGRVGGEFYLLDQDGVLFKKLTSEDDVDVPVLTGYDEDGKLNGHLLNTTVGLLNYLAGSKSFPNIHTVSEIHGSATSGLTLITDNGFCLKLGFDDYEGKLKRLLGVLTALNKKNIEQQYLQIDLRDVSKIHVEKRGIQKPGEVKGGREGFRT